MSNERHREIVIREPSMSSNLAAFFISRWRGEAPLAIVFWRDMIFASTALNVLLGVLALALYAAEAPIAVVLIVFFALFPWNLFLVLAVWRSANHATSSVALLTRTAAAVWLVGVTMI
jgi:hypothetical protein